MSAAPDMTRTIAPESKSTELSERRTGMSFQRTRMSADRTLMSIIRTSLSLISFGFTIFTFFQHLKQTSKADDIGAAPRHFGLSLVLLGVGMLTAGIAYHLAYMRELRRERMKMAAEGLIHAESSFPPSLTVIVAMLLLLIGLMAIASMWLKIGPYI